MSQRHLEKLRYKVHASYRRFSQSMISEKGYAKFHAKIKKNILTQSVLLLNYKGKKTVFFSVYFTVLTCCKAHLTR